MAAALHAGVGFRRAISEHMVKRGFKHRQIRPCGNTNAGTRYANAPLGNSPTLCSLDDSGFADLEAALADNIAATSELPTSNPAKFTRGSTKGLKSSVERTWEHAPSDRRII